MKKILIALNLFGLIFFTSVKAVSADVSRIGSWNMTGAWVLQFNDPEFGSRLYDVQVNQTGETLIVSGTSHTDGIPVACGWTGMGSLTSGAVTFIANYHDCGYTGSFLFTGNLNEDGTLSGAWKVSTSIPPLDYSVITISGSAIQQNHGQYVSSQEDKQAAAQSDIGMPVQSQK